MHHTATRRSFAFLVLPVVAALMVIAAPRADAQVNPLWDHYKLYVTPPLSVPPIPLLLRDQFGVFPHQAFSLDMYMNPTEKVVVQPPPGGTFPINDPILHYSWWRIDPQPFNGVVTAVNQFGDHTINVHDARWLLNPSVKNMPGQPPPPNRNHYKCYDCDGPPVIFQLRLIDQFGPWDVQVGVPRWFCNPAEKQVGGQPPNQIVDPNQHYICYEFTPPDPNVYPVTITDQFVTNVTRDLVQSRWVCVPTYKTGVTENKKNTWGQLKQLYR
jgi:hypothetical protein